MELLGLYPKSILSILLRLMFQSFSQSKLKNKILGLKKEPAYDISHLTFKIFDHAIEASHRQAQVCPAVIDNANMSPKHMSLQIISHGPMSEQMPREHTGKASKPK